MTIKQRAVINKDKAIEVLANELADKPYGDKLIKEDNMIRTTITLPAYMLHELEDLARKNKRTDEELKSVSAIIRNSIKNILHK